MNILSGVKEIVIRFKNGKDLPLFFKRLRLYAAILIPVFIGIAEAVPTLNIVLFVMNKGTEYQDVIRILPVLTAINIGLITASQLTLNEQAKANMQAKLNKDAIQ